MKNNLLRKICSCMLIFAVIFSSQVVAFGQETTDKIAAGEEITREWIVESDENNEVIIKTVDYPNGDGCVYMIENDEIIYATYLDRDLNKLTEIDYKLGTTTEKIISPVNKQSDASMKNGLLSETDYEFVDAGEIGYIMTRTVQGETSTVESNLAVQYAVDSEYDKSFDLNGEYQNMASLIGTIAGMMSIPLEIANKVAAKIVSALGIVSTIVSFQIPSYEVRTVIGNILWRGATANGNGSPSFDDRIAVQGKMYRFLHPDKSIETDYEGDYYYTISIANKNTELAMKLGRFYYPGFTTYQVVW